MSKNFQQVYGDRKVTHLVSCEIITHVLEQIFQAVKRSYEWQMRDGFNLGLAKFNTKQYSSTQNAWEYHCREPLDAHKGLELRTDLNVCGLIEVILCEKCLPTVFN